jgi:hypothetical protein
MIYRVGKIYILILEAAGLFIWTYYIVNIFLCMPSGKLAVVGDFTLKISRTKVKSIWEMKFSINPSKGKKWLLSQKLTYWKNLFQIFFFDALAMKADPQNYCGK